VYSQSDTVNITIGKRTYLAHGQLEIDDIEAAKAEISQLDNKLKLHNNSRDSLINLLVTHNDEPEKVKHISEQIREQNSGIDNLKTDLDKKWLKLKNFELIQNHQDSTVDDNDNKWHFDFDWDDLKFTRKDDVFRGHWAGVELSWCALSQKGGSLSMKGDWASYEQQLQKSWALDLNFIEINLPFSKPNFGLVTGMGLGFNAYSFSSNFRFQKVDGKIATQAVTHDLTSNKLNTTFLNIPLILELQFPKSARTQLHIGIGIVGGIRLHSSQEITWTENGSNYTETQESEMLLNSFRYGATLRLGYGFVHLFANYTLTPFFQKDKAPELYPLQIGVVLLNL
jgi:hypothetical protein